MCSTRVLNIHIYILQHINRKKGNIIFMLNISNKPSWSNCVLKVEWNTGYGTLGYLAAAALRTIVFLTLCFKQQLIRIKNTLCFNNALYSLAYV